jgi:hypothetical protein
MRSQKVVIPAKAGIQGFCNNLKFLDSRLRGNDGNEEFSRICEFININALYFIDLPRISNTGARIHSISS